MKKHFLFLILLTGLFSCNYPTEFSVPESSQGADRFSRTFIDYIIKGQTDSCFAMIDPEQLNDKATTFVNNIIRNINGAKVLNVKVLECTPSFTKSLTVKSGYGTSAMYRFAYEYQFEKGYVLFTIIISEKDNKMLINSFKKADAISVLSLITKVEMKKLTNKFVHLIPFGVDINKFSPQKSKSTEKIKIGTIRTLSEKYGVEYLIRAFAEVRKKHKNIQLEIVGDGPLRSFLENLTLELGIENNVTFYGYVNQNSSFEQYINILGSLDVFAILSILDSETFGVAAVEASACGIPVLATSVGGLPEVIDAEKTGIIVAPKNVEETAKALDRLISDENLRNEMGRNGRKKVEEHYNWKSNVEQMIHLYKQTIENSKK